MKQLQYITLGILGLLLAACEDRYAEFNGNAIITGYAYINDTPAQALPLANQVLYVNNGDDTGTYVYQVKTDGTGRFSISSLKEDADYVLFTRMIKDGIEYTGATKIKTGADNNTVALTLYPQYRNGLQLLFVDTLGGPVPNLSFRLYTSRLLASVDSADYAYLKAKSDINGRYNKYDLPPAKYYIVANDSIPPFAFYAFDSVTISANGINPQKEVKVK